jgi:hypothetical protein
LPDGGAARRHDAHAGDDLLILLPSALAARLERSILGFAGVEPIRQTLLGTVNTATNANRQGWARPDERLRQAPHRSLPQHANETLAMSNSRACLHVREKGIGNLQMLVSLASSHFQHVGWK